MKFKHQIKKISAVLIASFGLLLNSMVPALAQTTVEISGNGAGSTNEVEVASDQTNTVVQSNSAVISNVISGELTTGGNEANENTGGDVTVDTGAATAEVDITNAANLNAAVVCDGCVNGNTDLTISGNGADSENEIETSNTSTNEIFQDNNASYSNEVDLDVSTGENEANENTDGNVDVQTGNATVETSILNVANANLASIGGNNGNNTNTLTAYISGNGADSENEIEVAQDNSNLLVQNNSADILNLVELEAETGENEANENTNGDVSVDTGSASVGIDIENWANFNAAAVGCDCVEMDVDAAITGNGADSENEFEIALASDLNLFQGDESEGGNLLTLANIADFEAASGENETNENTGNSQVDTIETTTGRVSSSTKLMNLGNVNLFGGNVDLENVLGVDLSFDLGELFTVLNV